jgi:tripartite-type tricarboxylate transporter receptor subunit TctC
MKGAAVMRHAIRRNLARQGVALALLVLAVLHGSARADDCPSRPITLMVPLAPGGGMDFIARTIGQKLSERIGKPVLVENRPGGGTVVAAVALAKTPADGYTLLLVPGSTLTTNATVYKSLPYDPRKDFVPVALTSQVAFMLVVTPSLPVKSVAELINYAKAKPGDLIVGTAGIATTTHLAGELLAYKTGIKLRYAHYRGSPPAMNDVIAGTIHMMFADPVTGAALAKDGKVRALAVTSKTRISALPELAPIADAGVPGYEATNWHMVVAPANTPPDIVNKLSAEIRAIVAMPEVKQQIVKLGLEPLEGPPPAELRKFLDSEIEAWGKLVQQIGLAGSL